MWVTVLGWISVLLAGACSLVVVADLLTGHPQKMKVMNIVWPVTMLYFGPVGLWAYFAVGRKSAKPKGGKQQNQQGQQPRGGLQEMRQKEEEQPKMSRAQLAEKAGKPFPWIVAVSDSHCGADCALGDAVAEAFVLWTGWKIAGSALWPRYFGDYALAYLLGILFQYFAVVPMRKLRPLPGLWAAVKADTLSITTFEVGMFAWMALSYFLFFTPPLKADTMAFWFMMQIAMVCGFATSYPMNWWLVRRGVKEAM